MANSIKRIMIISGEPSGDRHGAKLIEELKKTDSSIHVAGMGGPKMLEAGLDGVDSTSIAVVGLFEVLKHYGEIKGVFNSLVSRLDSEKFDAVVLIDYPDFNLRFADKAYERNIPIVYYISPQVWAWRKRRVKHIAKVVKKMLVAFPFEEDFYKDSGVDAEFVGHPLLDHGSYHVPRDEARKELGLGFDENILALLPGSRVGEVKSLLPVMLDGVAELNKNRDKKFKALLAESASVDESIFDRILDTCKDVEVIRVKSKGDNMVKVLSASDSAVVASGTASLETALTLTPMVIVYKVSIMTYWILKSLVGMDNIGLPNIVAGRRIVPELVQGDFKAKNIAGELSRITEPEENGKIREELKELKNKLGTVGAARRAAEAIFKII